MRIVIVQFDATAVEARHLQHDAFAGGGFRQVADLVANGSRVERKSLRRDIAHFQFGRQFGQRPLNAFQFDAEIADQVQRFEVEVAAEISD